MNPKNEIPQEECDLESFLFIHRWILKREAESTDLCEAGKWSQEIGHQQATGQGGF